MSEASGCHAQREDPQAHRSSSSQARSIAEKGVRLNIKRFIVLPLFAVVLVIAACGTPADTVSKNIAKEAEQFKVGRRIVVTNSITDKTIYSIEGRCSFEESPRRLDVTCRDRLSGPENRQYTKATILLGDNTTVASVQLDPITVNEYRTKILISPQSIVPDLDLVTGDPAK